MLVACAKQKYTYIPQTVFSCRGSYGVAKGPCRLTQPGCGCREAFSIVIYSTWWYLPSKRRAKLTLLGKFCENCWFLQWNIDLPWFFFCQPLLPARSPKCLPYGSQMPLRCFPDASQMPPKCPPDASQMSPRNPAPWFLLHDSSSLISLPSLSKLVEKTCLGSRAGVISE